MKTLLLLLLTLFSSCMAMAQISRDSALKKLLLDPYYCDTPRTGKHAALNKFYYTDKQYITNYSMNRLIRKDITKITLGEDGLPVLGNYASLKYSSDNSNITLNTSIYNPFLKANENNPIKNILSVNIKAGITDGAASLFSNKDINTGVGVKIKMSFLTNKTLYVNNSILDCNTLNYYRDHLYYNYIQEAKTDSLSKLLRLNDFGAKFKKLQTQCDSDRRSIATRIRNGKTLSDIQLQQIATHLDSASLNLLELTKAYNIYMNENHAYNKNAVIDSYYAQLLDLETKNAKWKQFRIEFWDVNVNIAGDKYNIFIKTLPIGKQLSKANFTTWSVGTTFNHFASNNDHAFIRNGIFYKVGYALSDNNNFVGTKTKTITNTTTIDSTGFKREVVDNVSAYVGPLKKFYAHTIMAQASKYLDEKKSNALSLYTSIVQNFDDLDKPFALKDKPNWTVGTGYSFSLLDKDKEKAVINLELYLNFTDVLNSLKDKSTFIQRKEIGLKVGVPFNSIFLNK